MRLRYSARAFALVTFVSAACAHGPGKPLGKEGPLLTASGETLKLREFADRVREADYVLVGESHENACDHRSQALLVTALAERRPSVGLEMVSTERQPILDRFNAGGLPLDALPEALDWEKQWGVDFALYAPIFQSAAEAKLPIVALNVPRSVLKALREKGFEQLSPEERLQLPEDIFMPSEEQTEALREQFDAHREHMKIPDSDVELRFGRFMLVQAIWDTAMATRAMETARSTERAVVVLAGTGHVERRWGIALRLEALVPGAQIVTVLPWRGGAAPDAEEADFFFYCPDGE